MGTEEVDSILRQASHANARPDKKTPVRRPAPKLYRGAEHSQNAGPECLLVDGYNIIHAWEELRNIADVNIDGARGKLLDILSNYSAYSGVEVIAVFDSYRVPGHAEEATRYHNIQVVYTRQSETADAYLERYTLQHAGRRRLRIATSDELVQIGIRGAGGYVISARELQALIRGAEDEIREKV